MKKGQTYKLRIKGYSGKIYIRYGVINGIEMRWLKGEKLRCKVDIEMCRKLNSDIAKNLSEGKVTKKIKITGKIK